MTIPPIAVNFFIYSCITSFAAISSAALGSSISNIFECFFTAQAIESLFFIPSLKVDTLLFINFVTPRSLIIPSFALISKYFLSCQSKRLSFAESSSISGFFCGIIPTRNLLLLSSFKRSYPSQINSPSSASVIPANIERMVVFPLPFPPKIPIQLPNSILRDTPFRISLLPYLFFSPAISILVDFIFQLIHIFAWDSGFP